MISFSDFLVEHVENPSSVEAKKKYVDEVWQILQDSYKYCGGIHGSGFKSKQDMIDNIPFWKLQKKGGKIVACVMYKDKGGRKMVALGSDGSPEGKKAVRQFIFDDIKHQRAYGEVSDAVQRFIIKHLTEDEIEKYFVPAERVEAILHKPVKPTGKFTYTREIGGHEHEKMMYGVPGKGFKGK